MKNYTKSEQNHAKYLVFTQNFNPRYLLEKTKFKNFLVSISTLDELFNDTTHISLRLYIGQNCLNKKNPF